MSTKIYKYKTDLRKNYPYCADFILTKLIALLRVNHPEKGLWVDGVFLHNKPITNNLMGLLNGYHLAAIEFTNNEE